MKLMVLKRISAIFVILILLCAGCVPAQSGTVSTEVTFPLAVRDCAPKQMSNSFNTRYYLSYDHVLYGWGVNYAYSLGLPLPEQYASDQPVKLAEDVMDVEGCGNATFILKADKTLLAIGNYPNPETGGEYCEQFTKIAEGIAEIKNYSPGSSCCFVLKETGELYIIGSTHGNIAQNYVEMRFIDTDVTRLNSYFYESAGDGQGIAIMDSIVYNYYFSYYKQDDIWYLSEDAGGNFTTEKRHEHVQYTDTFAYYYIDNNSNLCINGYYVTGAGDSIRPTNGIKIVANDVIQCFGAEGGSYGYLTKNGDLYYTGIDVKDLSRGCAEAGVI